MEERIEETVKNDDIKEIGGIRKPEKQSFEILSIGLSM
jgi:hypothetical protein